MTIVDNDPIPPGSAQLDIAGGNVREGASGDTATITFTVTRSGETTTAVSTNFATTSGTATETVDFTPASGTVSFIAGQTTATIDVSVVGDRLLEHNETFFVTLVNPSAGVAYGTPQATGRILDDDTRTTLRVSKRGSSVFARGLVSPARPGHRIAVTLFKRKGGAWVRVRGQRSLLSGKSDLNGDTFTDSAYAAKFRRSDATRCRITAAYRGDTRFAASVSPCGSAARAGGRRGATLRRRRVVGISTRFTAWRSRPSPHAAAAARAMAITSCIRVPSGRTM